MLPSTPRTELAGSDAGRIVECRPRTRWEDERGFRFMCPEASIPPAQVRLENQIAGDLRSARHIRKQGRGNNMAYKDLFRFSLQSALYFSAQVPIGHRLLDKFSLLCLVMILQCDQKAFYASQGPKRDN
jgi:hypothetical protein